MIMLIRRKKLLVGFSLLDESIQPKLTKKHLSKKEVKVKERGRLLSVRGGEA